MNNQHGPDSYCCINIDFQGLLDELIAVKGLVQFKNSNTGQ